MQIKFSDGNIYNLDVSFSYDRRLELVNKIIDKYSNDFNNYWESKGGKQQHHTKTTLDILGAYLYYGSTKELNQKGILTDRQLRRRNGELEIPVGLYDEKTESLLEDFVETKKVQNPIKSVKKYSQTRIHKLNCIYIHPSLRVNRQIKDKPQEYRFYIDKDNKTIKSEESDFLETISINCFTKEDLKLPYIDKSLSYLSRWCYVDEDNIFKFCCFKFKINLKYKFDQVLVIVQNNKIHFIDFNINLLNKGDVELVSIR